MRLLVIGGTRFIGRHLAELALGGGHDVTVFHRGQTADGHGSVLPGAEHRLGDRNSDLSALANGTWDATIDMCAYVPRHVHELADVLNGRGGRYTFVSSVSAYASPVPVGFREAEAPLARLDDETVEEVTDTTYGGLKVLGERAAVERFGSSTLIVRPTYVVGPFDLSWRFPRWVMRLAAGGVVLAPGPSDDPTQVIDARDLAAWMLTMNERGDFGVFHAVGPQPAMTWGELLACIASVVAPEGTSLRWVGRDFLLAQGVTDADLPLWPGAEPDTAMLTADPTAAIAAGLRLRPLVDTIVDTLQWAATHPEIGAGRPWLSEERERALLAGTRAKA